MPPPPLAAISSSSRLNVAGSIEPPPFQNRYSGSCDRAGAVNAPLIPWACADGTAPVTRTRPTTTPALAPQPIKPFSSRSTLSFVRTPDRSAAHTRQADQNRTQTDFYAMGGDFAPGEFPRQSSGA